VEPTTLLTALIAIVGTAAAGGFFWRRASIIQQCAYKDQVNTARELEKRLHEQARDFLAERNQLELAQMEKLKNARSQAFEEGRQLGLSEARATHVNELADQRKALFDAFETARDQAVAEAMEKVRTEYEIQSKLFGVKISPYVSIKEERNLIRHCYETVSGYQYQLLVNGIPAFAPHVVAEKTEVKKVVNSEVERLLVQSAERAADAAIKMYLGGSSQFATLAEPIIRRLPK